MTSIDSKIILNSVLAEAKKYLVSDEKYAYFKDPVFEREFHLIRNRVNGELCKALIRAGDIEQVPKLINYICDHQHEDGSWDELHPYSPENPSALITSFLGEVLIEAYHINERDLELKAARDYVLSKELAPGYFLKSEKSTPDHLNVDASCGSFLAKYGQMFHDADALKAAKRAALRVCEYQFNDGAYPYTIDKGSYAQKYDIPCIHYQGVTMYYLQKINEVLHDPKIDESLLLGAKWLASVQYKDGRFDWSESGLNFAYYLSGAPAFAYAVFSYAARIEPTYAKNAELSLQHLQRSIHGIMLRWEPDNAMSLPRDIITSWKSAFLGTYPMKERMFRFGYCMYRQIARRRYSNIVDPKFFRRLCSMMKINPSTVEPFNNFPDMFMTSEVLDCLSWTYDSQV